MMRPFFPLAVLLLAAPGAWGQAAPAPAPESAPAPAPTGRVLTLAEALRAAQERQPQLRQAQASTAAANARVDQNFASFLPQVSASGNYQRGLSAAGDDTTDISGYVRRGGFTFGASASQLLWDFGRTPGRWHAAQQNAQAQASLGEQTQRDVLAAVQTAYFAALAQQALVRVGQDTLANEQAHLAQVNALVEVGSRPEIDRLQQRTAVSNAQLQLIQAQGNAAATRAQLNQAMGVEDSSDYTLSEEQVAVVEGEAQPIGSLVQAAFENRPDLAASDAQLRAQEYQLSATRGNYWPSFTASLSATESGPNPANLSWGVNGQVGLSWPLFQGGLTRAQVREQQANINSVQAQRDALRQQVRLQVERAQLSVTTARQSVTASEEALANAREQLRLAEGRYKVGVGNIIELADAQLAATNAAVQRIQANYNLATARTELARSLGRLIEPT